MSDQSILKMTPLTLKPWMIPAGIAALAAVAIAALRPDFSLIGKASPVVQIHLAAAVASFALGVVIMNSRKGRTFHRIAGWTYVIFMLAVAISSLFIVQLNHGHWSFIHLFSALTLIGAPMGVIAARRHDVKSHRGTMTGLFYGGMVIAGAFTFVPGRLMFQVFFGH